MLTKNITIINMILTVKNYCQKSLRKYCFQKINVYRQNCFFAELICCSTAPLDHITVLQCECAKFTSL